MTSAFNPNGRFITVEINFGGDIEDHEIYIMNHPDLYEELSNDDAFDQRVWFYFKDEEEYKSYFNENNGDDWFIIRELEDD